MSDNAFGTTRSRSSQDEIENSGYITQEDEIKHTNVGKNTNEEHRERFGGPLDSRFTENTSNKTSVETVFCLRCDETLSIPYCRNCETRDFQPPPLSIAVFTEDMTAATAYDRHLLLEKMNVLSQRYWAGVTDIVKKEEWLLRTSLENTKIVTTMNHYVDTISDLMAKVKSLKTQATRGHEEEVRLGVEREQAIDALKNISECLKETFDIYCNKISENKN